MNQSEVVGSLLLRFSDLEEVDVQNLDFHAGKFQLNSASRISPFSICLHGSTFSIILAFAVFPVFKVPVFSIYPFPCTTIVLTTNPGISFKISARRPFASESNTEANSALPSFLHS